MADRSSPLEKALGANAPVISAVFLIAGLVASVLAGVTIFLLYERPVDRHLRRLVLSGTTPAIFRTGGPSGG